MGNILSDATANDTAAWTDDIFDGFFRLENDNNVTNKFNRGSGPIKKGRSEEHTSELQSHSELVCRLLLEKKKQQ